jgi:hypothetical protein
VSEQVTVNEIKPGLIVSYPETRYIGPWKLREVSTGRTIQAVVVAVEPSSLDRTKLNVCGYVLTQDGRISLQGKGKNSKPKLRYLPEIEQIVGAAEESLMQEARSLALPEWIGEESAEIRQKAITDQDFFARARTADQNRDMQIQLIAEALGITEYETSLKKEAELIAEHYRTVAHDLGRSLSLRMEERAIDFGIDQQVKGAYELICKAIEILGSLDTDSILEARSKVRSCQDEQN